jgi:excisionase family DNA binding protein
MNDLLSVANVAEELQLTQARIYQLVTANEIPSVRIGNRIRIPRAAWNQWLADKSAEALASVRASAANEDENGELGE